ncbi:GT2 family glycosyltransferase [Actinoalloteichus hoggarensis]|uniref:Glycosyl transferase family 2 n=1 Tax=Actinoalloteichus hoggarensis TaxID=1470176 RepID=A0A221W1X4_9PSEU|nr:glycosyltransferase [Actinoalloteichus hoggarensis]ASO19591.1 Glycosyl transferase family 2 [Actinoalloteichus hoggarensis]MBB5919702.1 GT2 family glycosyltransferase [Actinoalloteichus hoggarensis]
MSTPRTTVVIATRNRAAELHRTLTRVRALRPAPPIIVVDNASSDDTAARAAGVAGVRVIRLRRNLGAAARNLGVAGAVTPFVAFADDDSWWAEDALPVAERLLTAHPRVALLAGRTLVGPTDADDPVNRQLADSPLGQAPDLPGPSILGFLACAAIVRRQAFLEVGGFSRLLHFGAEERLLAVDLAARGWALCYAEQVRAHHHPSSTRPPPAWRVRIERRNNALIDWLRRPWRRCLAETGGLLWAAPRDGESRRVAAGVLRRLPAALVRRSRLPPEIERQARTLEHSDGEEPSP